MPAMQEAQQELGNDKGIILRGKGPTIQTHLADANHAGLCFLSSLGSSNDASCFRQF